MAKSLDNGCAQFYRFILLVLNTILFIIGLTVFICALVLKYGKTIVKDLNVNELDEVIKLSEINIFIWIVFAVGTVVLLISLIGICGLCYLNKCILNIYEIIIILLFTIHAIGLIVFFASNSSIENEIKDGIQKLTTRLNSSETFKNADCDVMKLLSNVLKCCGAESSDDFLNNDKVLYDCCGISNSTIIPKVKGCSDATINELNKDSKNLILIPSAVILGIELIIIVATPLMGRSIFRQ